MQLDFPVTVADMRAELERELEVRRHAYPRFVSQGRLKPEQAEYRVRVLEAAIKHLTDAQDGR